MGSLEIWLENIPASSGHGQLQPHRGSSAAVPIWTTKRVAWVLGREGLDTMYSLKQFKSHYQKSASSHRLLPLDPAWYILPLSPFYRVKAVSRLTVHLVHAALLHNPLASWLRVLCCGCLYPGCASCGVEPGLVAATGEYIPMFWGQLHNSHDFLFSRVSAEVYAVDCSRVITTSWYLSTTLCGLLPEGCLSLWPRLERMWLYLVAWS